MRKKVLILISSLLLIFVLIITYYKFGVHSLKNKTTESKFVKYDLVDRIDNIDYQTELDKDTYWFNILDDSLKTINYTYYDDGKSIYGKVYLNNGYLYISDDTINETKRLSDIKFKSIYTKDYEYDNIYIYMISEDNDLYYLEVYGNDISKSLVKNINLGYKVTNFALIDFITDTYKSSDTLFVLSIDGNIYDAASGIRYKDDIVSLFDRYYVFSNKEFTDVYGRTKKKENGEYYKIKYSYFVTKDNDLVKSNNAIIITDNNRLMYMDGYSSYIYIYSKYVTNIEYNENSILKITFDDNSSIDMEVICSENYCNI